MKRASPLGTRALSLVFAFAWCSSTLPVSASDLVLEWSAPEDCPDRAQVASRVGQLIGGNVQPDLGARVEVTYSDGAYRAQVRITSVAGVGERTLSDAQCDWLAESVALVIALGVSSDTAAQRQSRTEPSERPALALSARASVLFGSLPHAAAGVGGALAVEGPASLRFEAHGDYYSPQSEHFAGSNSLGAEFRLLAFGGRACRLWSLGRFDLAPCLGVEVHYIRAAGFGGEIGLDDAATLWGPVLGVFGRLRLIPALGLYVAVDAFVPVSRPAFVFADVGELHQVSPVAVQLLIAPEVRF